MNLGAFFAAQGRKKPGYPLKPLYPLRGFMSGSRESR
jgi:hypothetical protein